MTSFSNLSLDARVQREVSSLHGVRVSDPHAGGGRLIPRHRGVFRTRRGVGQSSHRTGGLGIGGRARGRRITGCLDWFNGQPADARRITRTHIGHFDRHHRVQDVVGSPRAVVIGDGFKWTAELSTGARAAPFVAC